MKRVSGCVSRIKNSYRKIRKDLDFRRDSFRGRQNPLRWYDYILIFLLGLVPAVLSADMIHLKNGTTVEGYFLNMEGSSMVFRTFNGEIRVSKDEILKVEMGYSGIPMCYGEDGAEPICGGLLHAVFSDHFVFVASRGSVDRQTLDSGQVDYITFRKESPEQKIIPILNPDTGLEVREQGKLGFLGRVVEIEGDRLRLVDDDTGREVLFREKDLREGTIRFLPPIRPTRSDQISRGFSFLQLVPGVYQWERGEYWKTGLYAGGFLVLGAAFAAEYQAASKQDEMAMQDPAFLLYDNPGYRQSFRTHQQNQAIAGALVGLLYTVHLADAGFFSVLLEDESGIKEDRVSTSIGPGRCGPGVTPAGERESFCSVQLQFRF